MDRDLVWGAVRFMRDNAKWGGNRFEIVLAGINFTIQRRGRLTRRGRRGPGLRDSSAKTSDTYLARGDHGWLIIVRDFNFQNMVPKNASGHMLHRAKFDQSEVDFEGDMAQFEHDYVMMRMFGDW